MEDDYDLLKKIILMGGPNVGFLTNPEVMERPGYIEVGDEKLVCLAQGGECRSNPKYYEPGMRSEKSWKTPIIDETCPDKCIRKKLVCDNHPEHECPSSYRPVLQYNKFQGLFATFCREFSRLEEKVE